MTCIVGMVSNGQVYIGADRGISNEESIISSARPKVYENNGWVFGYAGSVGTGQLLEFINFPKDVKDPYKTLRLHIVEEYRKAIASFGNNEEEHCAEILIGYGDKLFEFNTLDWGVVEVRTSAVGSGNQYALGCLYGYMYGTPEDRLEMAIRAALHYSPTCIGPIDILSTNG